MRAVCRFQQVPHICGMAEAFALGRETSPGAGTRSGGVLCHRREPTPGLKKIDAKAGQRGLQSRASLSDGPIRAASLAPGRVRLPYHVPYNGVRAHGLEPRFWCFFSAEQEAVRRVLRENADNTGQREGELGASQSRRPPHFRILTTSTLLSARAAASTRQQRGYAAGSLANTRTTDTRGASNPHTLTAGVIGQLVLANVGEGTRLSCP
jgi:hypothetical protein